MYLVKTDHLPAEVIELFRNLIERVAADKKMVGLYIERLICKNIISVRGNDVLDHGSSLAYAPLTDNDRKAVFERVFLQEISDVFLFVYPDEVLA